jgi:multiple sugar transport system permease protein
MKAKNSLAHLVVHLVLIAGSLLFLFPLIWMFSTSLKPIEETMVMPPRLLPSRLMFENYPRAVLYQSDKLGFIPFLRYALNTLYVAGLGVVGAVLSNALVAYGLARIPWRGRNLLFGLTIATMMIPWAVLMVPIYVMFRHAGLVGTLPRSGCRHSSAAPSTSFCCASSS